jgi:hypothetical protein
VSGKRAGRGRLRAAEHLVRRQGRGRQERGTQVGKGDVRFGKGMQAEGSKRGEQERRAREESKRVSSIAFPLRLRQGLRANTELTYRGERT